MKNENNDNKNSKKKTRLFDFPLPENPPDMDEQEKDPDVYTLLSQILSKLKTFMIVDIIITIVIGLGIMYTNLM